MRCNNCGWENPESLRRCEKCNAPLKGSMIQHNDAIPEVQNDQHIAGTVKGDLANLPFLDEPVSEPVEKKQQLSKNQIACSGCGYPVNKDAVKCPNCNKVLAFSGDAPVVAERKKVAPGTVNPWDKPKHANCYFKPLSREGEKEFRKLEFSGEDVELNRENLEENNMTITSKVQASLQNIDGKWYLVDKSQLQTTFKHISAPIELKKGDIVLMGDRKFEFDV
jgi:hypothetical protein